MSGAALQALYYIFRALKAAQPFAQHTSGHAVTSAAVHAQMPNRCLAASRQSMLAESQ